MVNFGMPTLLGLGGLQSNLALCRELALSFLELNMNLPEYQPDGPLEEALQRAADQGVALMIHLDENLHPAYLNKTVAAAYRDVAHRTLRLAADAAVPIVVLHMAQGVYFTLPEEKVYLHARYEEAYLQDILAFRQLCEEALDGRNTRICIENTGGFLPFAQRGVELLLQSPAFALTLDVGHDRTASGHDRAFYEKNEQHIRHMHLHDATASANHLPLGRGEIDLPAALLLAQRQGCRCVLEVKDEAGLRASVLWLKEHGYLMPSVTSPI